MSCRLLPAVAARAALQLQHELPPLLASQWSTLATPAEFLPNEQQLRQLSFLSWEPHAGNGQHRGTGSQPASLLPSLASLSRQHSHQHATSSPHHVPNRSFLYVAHPSQLPLSTHPFHGSTLLSHPCPSPATRTDSPSQPQQRAGTQRHYGVPASSASSAASSAGTAPLTQPDSVWSLPNMLSVARGVSGPIIAYLILQEQWPWALGALAVSGVSEKAMACLILKEQLLYVGPCLSAVPGVSRKAAFDLLLRKCCVCGL